MSTSQLALPAAIVVVAMSEEAAPFHAAATDSAELPVRVPAHALTVQGRRLWLVECSIGMVAAASALTQALELLAANHPGTAVPVVSAGTAGGLGVEVNVRDVCVSTALAYSEADARIFGYELGQVPRQPARFEGDGALMAAARRAVPAAHFGLMLTGNSFVTAATATQVRELFPGAVSVDMESVALAQVARDYGLPFVSVRGVSDLCGPAADQEFHVGVDVAAARSATAVLALLETAAV
ncbi:5'-methylthioadenosine/S-adenosylhomocysteine nucleosidase [Buchananella felis]|uniref:5'-methylthioadenosine/S-adenosylhomocysteine nucleosidase n=1 Tax=Buchananella felis TaxID=3231492 RepID=UPI0035285D22